MNIHEYQAKLLLGEFQVPVARGNLFWAKYQSSGILSAMTTNVIGFCGWN